MARCAVLASLLCCSTIFLAPAVVSGQESPYFVAYDHYLEEPGSLEVEYFSTFGTQRAGDNFHAFWTELEYGVTASWTTEFYLEGQSTFGQSTVFTGLRWENRVRPLKYEHFINPILYLEYEKKSGADKILKEVEGHDVESDFLVPNALARKEHDQEMELKLILSSTVKGWNFTENTLAAKNLSNNPWEFGYALGASRPLALKASGNRCNFCRENFFVGVEMYGGLGDRHHFGLKETSHYLAPALSWSLRSGWSFRFSQGFGLNDNSHRLVTRWGVSREISGFGEMVSRAFRRRQ
ncbi:MAG: hypothetical protein DMG40_01425 [Acidobacteria bacterium]|nr:MAG: hypothetical protein DMG40_01425 [Acidobacteriota bacterium]